MASTRHTSAYTYAARSLILLAMSTSVLAQGQIVYKGCYSSTQPLTNHGSYPYQSNGHCQQTCVNASAPVLGLTDGSDCWCGNEIPAENTRVSDSECSIACDGYPSNICGGHGFWTVYLTGLNDNVPYYGSNSNSGGSKKQPSSENKTPTSSTASTPSVITSVGPGKTVIKTVPANPADASNSHNTSGGSSTNTVAIAAGVVVAVVIVSAVVTGTYFYLRHRRRVQTEEEHKRTQIVDFIRNGDRKPPPSGYSTTSDSRLDPEFGNKRNSHGSIADNEDFSRKILRVANPDRS